VIDNETMREIIASLKYAHGFFNSLLFLLFLAQGWHGLQLRKRRLSGGHPEVRHVKRHRALGPFLVILIIAGFAGGISSVYLMWEEVVLYPLHFLNGLAIAGLTVATYLVSRKIRARESRWRAVHASIGLAILLLYAGQIYLGLTML